MYRLFSLSSLLILVLVEAAPRTPKIYNVLISTKKNLSPSHALPVYEPVLRTTSLGFALPFVYYQNYQSPFGGYQSASINPGNFIPAPQPEVNPVDPTVNQQKQPQDDNDSTPPNNQQQHSLQPLPVEQFIPYSYAPQLLNNNHPFYSRLPQESPQQVQPPPQQPAPQPQQEQYSLQKSDDPKTIIANLKRNPEIPDVPPPALPVKTS